MKNYEMIDFIIPDERFPVAVARIEAGQGGWFVFSSLIQDGGLHHEAQWEKVEGCNVIFIGDVENAVAGLLSNYTNKELSEMLGLHPTPISKLRSQLGVAGGTGLGGEREGAGRPKKR